MMPTNGAASAFSTPAPRRGQAFGLSDRDAEDFYDVVMSSEDEDDASDAETESERTRLHDASLDDAQRSTVLATPTSAAPATVLKHIGSISYVDGDEAALVNRRTASIAKQDEEFKLTPDQLASHTQRRSALEIALDAAIRSAVPAPTGDAPFRFLTQPSMSVQSPAPSSTSIVTAGHAPQQSVNSKRKHGIPLAGVNEHDSDDDDEATMTNEPDPLYDDTLDDADDKWVQRNLRGTTVAGVAVSTDATLCCPCCFVTVCMDCQRHVKYPNQYRARVAMNCRVKKDEILAYASPNGHQTKQQYQQQQRWSSMTQTTKVATGIASARLSADEYFGVVCSDCGTTVGVYDAQQTYHFFNILPSNC